MTVVVKLGSSIVAGDDGSLRAEVLDTVCAQVGELEAAGETAVMVTSGAIARGMRILGLEARPRSIDELQAASAVGQGDLFRSYETRLAQSGVRAAQVLLTASDLASRANYLNARATLRRLLAWEIVPVINENDTTATDEITFGDNDFLAAQVAILLDARRLVLLTDTGGLYTGDPRRDPGAELVREVASAEDLRELQIGDRTSVFGSGGMRSKVASASMAAEAGVEAAICNGTVPGTLLQSVEGRTPGTSFKAGARGQSAFRLWLRHAKPSMGRIEIDSGALRALRDSGASLLPVGVTAVHGSFGAGDAVDVASDGTVIGKGIAECSAEDLQAMKGKSTRQISDEIAAGKSQLDRPEEVIHRDRLVLT